MPAVFVVALTVAALLLHEVTADDIIRFAAYLAFGLALPGTLIIRAVYRGERTLAEELALGVALGYALEIPAYLAARAAGLPLLTLAWPVTVYVLFLAVPRLRRHWKRRPRPAAPMWWSWSLALAIAYLTALGVVRFFRGQALAWPALATYSVDMPFHLALIGELKHHVPPTVPMVAGEPLLYHWFIYAHFAASSWITGIEPLVLLFRLGALPMTAVLLILLAMVARRVTGSRAATLLAVVGTVFMTAPNLYLGVNIGNFTWRGFQSWTGLTQTFGAMLFAPVVLLLADLLDGRGRRAGRWLLLGVFLAAVMGAKATHLPLLAAGLAAVAGVEMVRRRRPPWRALAALAMTAVCFGYAQAVLFGGARQAMTVDPLSMLRRAWGELTGGAGAAEPTPASLLGLTALYLVCLAVTWCGVLGLLCRPKLLLRPMVVLLLGMGAASTAAVLLLGHPHLGQLYFFGATYPYLMIVAAYGLVVAVRRARMPSRRVACAVGAGVVAACLIRALCDVRAPLSAGRSEFALYLPYAVLLGVVALAAAVLVATGRRALRNWVFLLVAFAAVGAPAAWCARVLPVAGDVPVARPFGEVLPVAPQDVPEGAVTVARWLRAHSGTDDLVATNVYCRWGYEDPCDSRQFWAAALSERRVLVEGWTYTSANMGRWRPGLLPEYLPFSDGERLRANDEAFRAPSASAMRRLREEYGVRWLLVDERRLDPGSKIGDFAEPRFRSGDYALYRLADGQTGVI